MEFILDMVHHNPGEPPFETVFSCPGKLAAYGYNGQVFKHINAAVTYEKLNNDIFPEGSDSRLWLDRLSKSITEEIRRAKLRGLMVFYHIDLFVLPKKLIELYKNQICCKDSVKVSMDREKTLEIHRIMLDEIFERFPEVDGLILRVGETYLADTPYHAGNSPIPLYGPYSDQSTERDKYVRLINFLRDEICKKHDRYLIFRTWDCHPDKFHANPDFYLYVTDRVEPHEKLMFSIKHTALDFWRRTKFNECLTLGRHPQIIEVQCQREYEGKGAYPNYVMDGVINGFEENFVRKGLKDIIKHPLIKGLYTWSRGGGWHGPYLKNEFWCDLNTFVISQFANHPDITEQEIFYYYCRENMKLSLQDSDIFRRICKLSAKAVLKGRYCEAYDKTLNEGIMPAGNWMRDDRLGGSIELREVFEYLYSYRLFEEALNEKKEAVQIWEKIRGLFSEMNIPDAGLREVIDYSIEYGLRLYRIVYTGWRILAGGFIGDKTGHYDENEINRLFNDYVRLWSEYRDLESSPCTASLYKGEYLDKPGMDESVNKYRMLCGK